MEIKKRYDNDSQMENEIHHGNVLDNLDYICRYIYIYIYLFIYAYIYIYILHY